MAPMAPPLAHLTQFLTETSSRLPAPSEMETAAAAFLTTIASERIRVHRYDWQGLRVDALLWHLPHLKPATRNALQAYIAEQWGIVSADKALPPTQEPVVPAAPMNPAPPADRAHETGGGHSQAGHTPDNVPIADARVGVSAAPAIRKDWFDGLTDWMAAIVSLWGK